MPRTYIRRDPAERFWAMVARREADDCWIWTGAINKSTGYGAFNLNGRGHSIQTAHRASWLLNRGPIADGLFVLHTCDVRACINPAHLFLGTQQDNVDDMRRKGRDNAYGGGAHVVHGVDHFQAKLTPDSVRQIRALVASGTPKTHAARSFGISRGAVDALLSRRSWKRVA